MSGTDEEISMMLEVIGDGNASTKVFIASIRQQIQLGQKKLSPKQVEGVRKVYYYAYKSSKELKPEPKTESTPNQTLNPHSGEIVLDSQCRIFYNEGAFGNSEFFQILKIDDDTIFIHPSDEKTRRSKKDNKEYPNCHSLSIKMEYYMMNKEIPKEPVLLNYTMNEKGMVVDLKKLKGCIHFKLL